jgi:hypothetical protein
MPLFNRILHPRINWIQLPELQNTLFVLVLLLLLVLETLRVFRGQKLVHAHIITHNYCVIKLRLPYPVLIEGGFPDQARGAA